LDVTSAWLILTGRYREAVKPWDREVVLWLNPSTLSRRHNRHDYGRVQPLSLTLSFGEIPWYDVRGEIQRCDWLKITISLEIHTGHIPKNAFFDRSQHCISLRIYIKPRNFAKRQCERQWCTPLMTTSDAVSRRLADSDWSLPVLGWFWLDVTSSHSSSDMNYIRCSIHTVECASTTSAPKPTSLGSSFKEATPRPHYSSLAGGVRGRVDARRTW